MYGEHRMVQRVLKMLKRIAYPWLLLSFAGLALYVTFYATFEFERSSLTVILAVVSFALTISILLILDDDQPRSEEKLENMTFAGLGYVLLVKRKPLVAMLVLTLVATGLIVYYLSKSMGITLETEGSTLTIKLPGQTVHYITIQSQLGWQNTGIELKAGQEVKYSIAGSVSPGYLQDIDTRSAQLRSFELGEITDDQFEKEAPKPKWRFTGPEGYHPAEYTELKNQDLKNCEKHQEEVRERCRDRPMAEQDRKDCDPKHQKEVRERCEKRVTKDYKDDTGLTVQGLPHNRVVGIILPPDKEPNTPKPPGKEPNNPSPGEPAYNYEKDEEKLINFKVDPGESKKKKITTKQAGILWVVINDAEVVRWDNAGLYFMQLVVP